MRDHTPWLTYEATKKHATMVLGGWTFTEAGVRTVVGSTRRYVAKNPQGEVVAVNGTLMICVNAAWDKGGSGETTSH